MTDAMRGWPTGRLLGTAARMVENRWIKALDDLGLTHAGLVTLHLLGDSATSQTSLAKIARVQNQTMSRTLDRLERQGYVSRLPDSDDRRRHVVVRTDSGRAIWLKARTLESDLFPGISDHESLRAALFELIEASGSEVENG